MVMKPQPKSKTGETTDIDLPASPEMTDPSTSSTVAHGSQDAATVASEGEAPFVLKERDLDPQTLTPPETDLPGDDFVPTRSPSPQWLLFALGLCAAVSSLAVGAFLWLMSIPPASDCNNISTFSPDRERLYCAQQSAASGDLPELLDGIEMLDEWTPEHPLYYEAQDWLGEWSDAVLAIARTKMYDRDIEGAIELAQQIPPSSPTYEEAQATLSEWQAIWDSGKYLYDKARMAIRDKNWESASQYILALEKSKDSYWRLDQTAALTQQMQAEKQAQANLTRARAQAKAGSPEALRTAVSTVSKIDRSTHTWWEAQADMNQWSEALLVVGLQKWQAGQLDDAIAIGNLVASNPNLKGTGTDLAKLAQARKHAFSSGSNWTATPKHLWNLMEAMALARQIQPTSKYYAQAQESLQSWELQLQDLTKLQAAQVAADLGQKPMLTYAIAQAQQVEAGRPRRLQSQTLIAHWNREVERMEDEPHLVQAQRLAQQGTVSGLKAAIAEASKVHLGHQLRPEAQGLIFSWNQEIQSIEDRPILNQAYTLARQGDLSGAIAQAGKIRSGRALYREAQGAIASWQAEIQAAAQAPRQPLEAQQRPDSQPQSEPTPASTPDQFSVKPSAKLDRLVDELPVQPSSQSAPFRDFYQPRPSAPEQQVVPERSIEQPTEMRSPSPAPGAARQPDPTRDSPSAEQPAEPPAFPSPTELTAPAPFPSPEPAAVETDPQPTTVEQGTTSVENVQSRASASPKAF
ncbi:MAG: hypothetical protein IGR76_16670 [Synechococcales cyanobacterium T60_A2020_003]|nr:hypothetical protein [Synechococcales cyanobacterium T60_A2020_003]